MIIVAIRLGDRSSGNIQSTDPSASNRYPIIAIQYGGAAHVIGTRTRRIIWNHELSNAVDGSAALIQHANGVDAAGGLVTGADHQIAPAVLDQQATRHVKRAIATAASNRDVIVHDVGAAAHIVDGGTAVPDKQLATAGERDDTPAWFTTSVSVFTVPIVPPPLLAAH